MKFILAFQDVLIIKNYLGGGSLPLASSTAKGRVFHYPLLGVPGEPLSVQLPPSGWAHPRTSLSMKKLSELFYKFINFSQINYLLKLLILPANKNLSMCIYM